MPLWYAGLPCLAVLVSLSLQGCVHPMLDSTKKVSTESAPCPYNFAKPNCSVAEPQAPRDLTDGAVGHRRPKAAVLNHNQSMYLPLTNVHYHLGAEHKSASYNDDAASTAYDAGGHARRLAGNKKPRPGFMCETKSLTQEQRKPYKFQHCTGDVAVGKTYEIHYVHSSAGYSPEESLAAGVEALSDGLGGAANGRGLLNPMIVVKAVVVQLVNGAQLVDDLLHDWNVGPGHNDTVMYQGSTTGQSHDNKICSPYSITWHVDRACHKISPSSFDKLCADMFKVYGMQYDLEPHGSRKLVDPEYVVSANYVTQLV